MSSRRLARFTGNASSINNTLIGWRLTCECGVTKAVTTNKSHMLPPEIVAKKFVQAGWLVGRRPQDDCCPECNRKRERAPTQQAVAENSDMAKPAEVGHQTAGPNGTELPYWFLESDRLIERICDFKSALKRTSGPAGDYFADCMWAMLDAVIVGSSRYQEFSPVSRQILSEAALNLYLAIPGAEAFAATRPRQSQPPPDPLPPDPPPPDPPPPSRFLQWLETLGDRQ